MSMVTSSGPQVFLWMVSLVNLDPLELTATDSTASISGMVVPRVRPIEIFSITADTDTPNMFYKGWPIRVGMPI